MRRLCLFLTGAPITAMTATAAPAADYQTMSPGLRYRDEVVGTGSAPHAGQTVNVHYTGWPYDHSTKGAKFDSSRDRGKVKAPSLSFRLHRGACSSQPSTRPPTERAI